MAVGVALLSMPSDVRAAGDAVAAASRTITVSPDPQVAALLNKLLQEVSTGQTTAPPTDNAMDTWQQVAVLTASNLSPGATKALDEFVHTARRGAETERAAGHARTALDLSVFADLAAVELKDRSAADAPSPPAPPAPALPPSKSEQHPIPTEAPVTDVATGAGNLETDAAATPTTPPATAAAPAGVPAPAAPTSRPKHSHPVQAMTQAVPTAAVPAAPHVTADAAAPPTVKANPELVAAYVSRGDQMLAIKDISAARKFYEYAADQGDASAVAKLAETYDPEFLHRIGAVGLQPDPAKAMALYRRAVDLGDADAEGHLRALSQQAAR